MNDVPLPTATDVGGRGLRCRDCGRQDFRVIYTRPTRGGRLLRRRECRHCGARFTTCEHVVG